MIKTIYLFILSALTSFGANGYLTVTNRTTMIGAGGAGGSTGFYVTITNRTTSYGLVNGGTNDGSLSVTNGVTLIPTNIYVPPPLTNDTGIAGMAYYWNYNDLTANTAVSAWPDRIQAKGYNQGMSSRQPTNSSSGVHFDGITQWLTNVSFTLPQSKYTLWIVFKPTGASAAYSCILSDTGGANGFFRHGSKLTYYQGGDRDLFALTAGTSYDFMYSNAGTGSAGGGIGYTNGIATATITDRSAAQAFREMGNDGGEPYEGYIKFVGIWTNATLSVVDAATLYVYSQTH